LGFHTSKLPFKCFSRFGVTFLLSLDFLQPIAKVNTPNSGVLGYQSSPIEFFTIHFVQFRDDKLDGVLQPGYDYMLYSINPSVRGSDDFIENHESGLERSKLNKCLQGFSIDLSGLCDLLSSSSQAGEVEVYVVVSS